MIGESWLEERHSYVAFNFLLHQRIQLNRCLMLGLQVILIQLLCCHHPTSLLRASFHICFVFSTSTIYDFYSFLDWTRRSLRNKPSVPSIHLSLLFLLNDHLESGRIKISFLKFQSLSRTSLRKLRILTLLIELDLITYSFTRYYSRVFSPLLHIYLSSFVNR